MTEALTPCPLCSALRPDASPATLGRNGWFSGPILWRGRRSGRFWIHRRLGCSHGPALGGASPDAEAPARAWNDWARAEAAAKADRLGFRPGRRAVWLYELGLIPLSGLIWDDSVPHAPPPDRLPAGTGRHVEPVPEPF